MLKEHLDLFRALKEKSNLSNQQIADKSCLSISTINRFFRGEIDNPSFDEVNRILVAMGYSLSGLLDSEIYSITRYNVDEIMIPYIDHITSSYKCQIELLNKDKEHLAAGLSNHRKLSTIAVITAASLMIFICVILIIDLTNTNVGWYRGVFNTFNQIFFGGASVL